MSQTHKFLLLFIGTVIVVSESRNSRNFARYCNKINANDSTNNICVIREYDPDGHIMAWINFQIVTYVIDEIQINGINGKSAKLTSNICKKFPALQTLNAMAIELNEIETDALKDCVNLKTIYLNQNNISFLDSSVFQTNRVLEVIQLENNKLITFDTGILNYLPKLESLFLSDNQLEEFVISDERIQLNNLHTIELHRNKIIFLDSNDIQMKFPNLRTLTICRSDIEASTCEMQQVFQLVMFREVHC